MAKLTLTDGTIFEGTTEELIALTEQFSGKVVDPVADSITNNGVEYTLVNRKAREGDVVILQDTGGDLFKVGKVYDVLEDVLIADSDGDLFELYRPSLRRTTETVLVYEPKAEPLKVGDYAVVEGFSVEDDGTVVELSNKWDMDGVRFNVITFVDSPIRSMGVKNLRKATDEEVAEAKANAVFTQVGRKPNEYHEGDIVRIVVASCVNNDGDIGEVTEEATDGTARVQVSGKSNRGNWESISHIEPIVFAESRLDLRK